MAATDSGDSLSLKDVAEANRILDQFEEQTIAGRAPLIEDVRDNVEPHMRRYVVKGCVSIEIERAASVTSDKLSDYRRRFPEYRELLEEVFESYPERISDLSNTIPLPAQHGSPIPVDLIQEPTLADSASSALLDGDKYEIVETIGEGSFGVVFKAYSKLLQRHCAIKVIKDSGSKDDQSAALINQEIEILRRLDHPGVVRLYDVETTSKGQIALVLELIEGRTLEEFWPEKRGRMPVQLALQIIKDVAHALGHVHEQGIFHLDLKPANILVDESRDPIRVVIADFGLAVFRSKRAAAPGNTAEYAAPEQFAEEYDSSLNTENSHLPGARSDLFSAGVVLYKLLTGQAPFDVESDIEREDWPGVLQSLRCSPESPRSIDSSIPARLSDICLRCLAFNPDDRFSSATDLLEALATLDAPPQMVHSETELLRLRPLTSRDRVLYRSILKAVPNSSLNTQIDPLLRLLLPQPEQKTADVAVAPPRILTISAPSGAGKSSWFCAGVLPALKECDHRDLTTVVLLNAEETADKSDAADEITAEKLRRQLIYRLSRPRSTTASLAELLTAWNELTPPEPDSKRPPKKLLIVIDQFEQWLSVHGRRENTQLQQALSLCDGHHLQAVIIFRNEFITAATTFLRRCHSRLEDGHNWFPIDLLTANEAADVLQRLLPAPETDGTVTQLPARQDGIHQSAHCLLREFDKREKGVCPAWVVLVARYMRKHTADPDQLHQQHSWADVAGSHIRELLEESGHKQTSVASLFPDIIRCLVGADTDNDLRRHVSFAQFQNACPKDTADADIDDALKYLESGDLIMSMQVTMGSNEVRAWQLTHEIWTKPLRHWLEQLSQSLAESLLASRTTAWIRAGEARHLLNSRELLQVTRDVPVKRRSLDQQRFLQKSKWKAARNWALTVLLVGICLPGFAILGFRHQYLITNFGLDSSLEAITGTPFFLRGLTRWSLWKELQRRKSAQESAASQQNNGGQHRLDISTAVLELALLELIEPNQSACQILFKDLLGGFSELPEVYRHDFVRIVRRHREYALKTASSLLADLSSVADPVTAAQSGARLTLLLLLLGEQQKANTALTWDPTDHSTRTLFIPMATYWLESGLVPESLLDKPLAPELHSALLLSLDSLPRTSNKNFISFAQTSYTSRRAAVRYAAKRLLNNWNLVPENHSEPAPGADWMIITNFELIRIPVVMDSATAVNSKRTETAWCAQTETTWTQVKKYCPELVPKKDARGRPITDLNLPASALQLDNLFKFINQLNEKSGFEARYRKRGDEWCDMHTPGFRLPYLAEFWLISAAGTKSTIAIGHHLPAGAYHEERVKYIHGQNQSDPSDGRNVPVRAGEKRPNPWGFCDTQGNVFEVCVKNTAHTAAVPDSAANRHEDALDLVKAGGAYDSEDRNTLIGNGNEYPNYRGGGEQVGFRLVLELPQTSAGEREE